MRQRVSAGARNISCHSYIKNCRVSGIPEQRGLVQLRNELVCHLKRSNDVADIESMPVLPEPISMRRACEQCGLLPVCATYHKVNGLSPAPPAFQDEIAPQATAHLTTAHLDFYR